MRWFNKWIVTFVLSVIIAVAFVFSVNIVVDPYGVFGDRIIRWYSYDMVKNPRIGKFTYLDKYHENYDSYIIGGSKSSAISPELLNEYVGANFYNMMIYGGDFYDYEKILDYILENYSAKNIFLHMSSRELTEYKRNRSIDIEMSAKVTKEPLIPYYFKYLKLDLKYSIEKLAGLARRRFDPFEYGYIIEDTGVYDKTQRDAEYIGTVEEFLEARPVFKEPIPKSDCEYAEDVLESLERIKNKCEQNGINFTFVVGATYETEMNRFNKDNFKKFLGDAAQITNYWDFSGYNSVSHDPRNFYDQYHCTYNVGKMILGKIYNDENIDVPTDFGFYVTKDNVDEYLKYKPQNYEQAQNYVKAVPILMYHHFAENTEGNSAVVTPKKFKNDITELKDAGYTFISYKDLLEFSRGDKDLPKKPIIISIDDGYASNYEYAFPILKELGAKACISVIGWAVGERKLGNLDIIPHFTWEQAREMIYSGAIDIQSHSYNMHFDKQFPPYRSGVLKLENETDEEYEAALREDFINIDNLITGKLGSEVYVFTYPYGYYSDMSEKVLRDMGYKISVTTEKEINYIRKGTENLFLLNRYNVEMDWASQDIVHFLDETIEGGF